jgi:hypothetical protein
MLGSALFCDRHGCGESDSDLVGVGWLQLVLLIALDGFNRRAFFLVSVLELMILRKPMFGNFLEQILGELLLPVVSIFINGIK